MIKSYSKINLSLRILKKMKNGYHDIQSNTFLIDLFDKIYIKKNLKKKDEVVFKGKFKKFIDKKNNSVLSTISILKNKKIIKSKNFYKITVIKNIPIFSGLGGGTSNAFFLYKYFYSHNSKKLLKNLGSSLGSDLILFLKKQTFQKNLYNIKSYKKKFSFYFLLTYPNIRCSTKYMFSKIKKFSPSSKFDFTKITSDEKFIDLLKKEVNDMQTLALSNFKPIKKILHVISIQKGCLISRMTGSGSVCFGMFKSRKLATMGLKEVKKKFPQYWCLVTKTI